MALKTYCRETLADNWFEERQPSLNGVIADFGTRSYSTTAGESYKAPAQLEGNEAKVAEQEQQGQQGQQEQEQEESKGESEVESKDDESESDSEQRGLDTSAPKEFEEAAPGPAFGGERPDSPRNKPFDAESTHNSDFGARPSQSELEDERALFAHRKPAGGHSSREAPRKHEIEANEGARANTAKKGYAPRLITFGLTATAKDLQRIDAVSVFQDCHH